MKVTGTGITESTLTLKQDEESKAFYFEGDITVDSERAESFKNGGITLTGTFGEALTTPESNTKSLADLMKPTPATMANTMPMEKLGRDMTQVMIFPLSCILVQPAHCLPLMMPPPKNWVQPTVCLQAQSWRPSANVPKNGKPQTATRVSSFTLITVQFFFRVRAPASAPSATSTAKAATTGRVRLTVRPPRGT